MRIPDLSEWSARSEISGRTLSFASSAIFLITPASPPFFTPKGSSVTMIADLPPRSPSMCARARMRLRRRLGPRAGAGAPRLPRAPGDAPPGRYARPLPALGEPLDVDVRVVDHRDD